MLFLITDHGLVNDLCVNSAQEVVGMVDIVTGVVAEALVLQNSLAHGGHLGDGTGLTVCYVVSSKRFEHVFKAVLIAVPAIDCLGI